MNNGPSNDPTVVDGLDGRDLLRAFIDALPDLVYVKDTESRYIIDNVGHAKTLGAACPEEIAGKTDFDFYPRELAERYRADEQEIVRSGQPLFDKEEPGVDEEGNERLRSTTKLPLRDDSGKIVGLVGVTREVTKREEAEQAFEESEERYRWLVESSPEAIAILSEEGKIVFTNAAGARIAGAGDPEELIGRPYLDFVHPDYRETAKSRVLQSQEGKTARLLEETLLRLDGSPVEVEVVTIPTTYEGKPAAQSIIKDITERKEAERKLRESEERFRALVQNASDIVTTLDAEGVIRYKSPAVERLLGYGKEEMVGDSVFDYIHLEDVEQVKKTFVEVLESPGVHPPVQFRFRHAGGSWRYVEAIRNNLLEDPNVQGIVVNTRDITERKEAEEALKESEERYRAVVEQTADAIFLVDSATKRILDFNARFQELLGYAPEELRDMPFYDVIPHDREGFDSNVRHVLENRSHYIGERSYRRKDGSLVDVEVSSNLINYDGKEVLCTVARDITERKRAEKQLKESEERHRAVVEQSVEGIYLFDPDTKRVLEANAAFEGLIGYTSDELLEMEIYDFVAHEREDIDRNVRRSIEERWRHKRERKYRRKDGSLIDVELSTAVIPYGDGEAVCCLVHDVTERKEAEEALKESEERFRSAFEDAPIGVALVGLDGCRLRVNHALCEMLGYSEEELLGKDYLDNIHPDDRETSTERFRQTLEEGTGIYTLERRYIHADGHTVWNMTSVSLIQDSQGNPSHFVCLHQDTTERKLLEEHLEHQAFHDSLTELPNRALFLDRLEHALARAGREGGSVAVLFVDLDDFKVVNDSLGHDAGNALLVEVAGRLQASVRPGDTVGRIFGDEFAILLDAPACAEEAERVTERIEERLRAAFDLDGQKVFVTPSIGIALGETAEAQPKEILRHADLAMYAAKRKGKAQYEVYNPSMSARVAKRMELDSELRRAVEREEFEVHYQPIIDLGSDGIGGIEALARWRHPEREVIPAGEFVRVAEETGLIRPIGQWVVEEACRKAKEWRERYPDRELVMGVNLSASQFSQQPDLVPKILSETGLDPSGLQLEITERAVMDDAEFSLGKLKKLKGLGVGFAIDDYGMGHSCLYYLKRMPLDSLKIDRAFVAGLGEDPGDEAIVSGTIGLAHALGLKVVAEGVESADQLAKLRELGCDLAQGSHFAEPLASEAITKLLDEDRRW